MPAPQYNTREYKYAAQQVRLGEHPCCWAEINAAHALNRHCSGIGNSVEHYPPHAVLDPEAPNPSWLNGLWAACRSCNTKKVSHKVWEMQLAPKMTLLSSDDAPTAAAPMLAKECDTLVRHFESAVARARDVTVQELTDLARVGRWLIGMRREGARVIDEARDRDTADTLQPMNPTFAKRMYELGTLPDTHNPDGSVKRSTG